MEGIAALEVAAEALPGAGGCGIRALEVRIRVVRRSSQRGGERRCDGSSRARPIYGGGSGRFCCCCFRGQSVIVLRARSCYRKIGARRRPGLFVFGGPIFTWSCIGRVPTGNRGSAGRNRIGPFPMALVIPASYTRGFARARAGYTSDRSPLSALAPTVRA